MRQWELVFRRDINLFEADVPEDLRPLLEKHHCLGFAFGPERVLQFYTEEQTEKLNQRLEKIPQGRHAARLLFMYMEVMEETASLQIPFPLGVYAGMDDWEPAVGLVLQDEEQIYLLEKKKLPEFLEALEHHKETAQQR